MSAFAQESVDDGMFSAWAQAIAESSVRRWTGPRVSWTAPSMRPALDGHVVRSLLAPVAVHGGSDVAVARLERVLASLELAHGFMANNGWGEPYPDGGRGGGDELDVYIEQRPLPEPSPGSFERPRTEPGEPDDMPERAIQVGWDAPITWAPLDAVTSFVRIDLSNVPGDALEGCVISAYAQAIIAAQDPAEAPAFRRALGAFLAWHLTGSLGCDADAIAWQQARPERGLITHAPGSGEAGAMLLGALSARHDDGSGEFVRDLVQAARQWTWEGEGLRAEPDIWHAIAHFLSVSRHSHHRLIEEVAIGRWFTGRRSGLGAHSLPILRAIPGEVPLAVEARWSERSRTLIRDLELEPQGSAYALVDVRDVPEAASLRVWLRGEFGVRWSMIAVRLDRDGRELGRMRTPVRREPRAYLPVELDESTAQVLIAVTNLSWRRPDADEPDENVRGFRLVIDGVRPGAE
jgi:hypothetical protein